MLVRMKIQLMPLGLAITFLATQASLADYVQATTNLYARGAGTNFVDSSATAAPNDLLFKLLYFQKSQRPPRPFQRSKIITF